MLRDLNAWSSLQLMYSKLVHEPPCVPGLARNSSVKRYTCFADMFLNVLSLNVCLFFLRKISSAGDYGRKKLRECEGLVDSLVYLVKKAIEKANIDNKSVENCVCVLRNLSFRAQEVEDPNYDKKQVPPVGETRAGAKPSSDNLGCFNSSKTKRKDSGAGSPRENPTTSRGPRTGPGKGMDLLWQPEVKLLFMSSNFLWTSSSHKLRI